MIFCLLQAFDRRGQARIQLGKYKEALEDFENSKKIEPKIPNIDKNIEEAKKKMAEAAPEETPAEAEEAPTEEVADTPVTFTVGFELV